MSKKFPILYKRDSKGRIQTWQITVDGGSYSVIEGLEDGKKSQTSPHICEGKNPGKKNETTAEQQALKEAEAKQKNKLEHGYCLTAEGIDDTGYKEPMLCKQYDDYKDVITFSVYVDQKLNGMRCNALKGSVKSRKGKDINTIPHIVTCLKPIFAKYPKLFLDGELFNPKHKNNLNRLIELTSVAYKPKDVTPELLKESEEIVQFHIYDGFGFDNITQETLFLERREALKKLLRGIKYIHVLDYKVCNNDSEIQKLLLESKNNNDEGIIIRWGDAPYEFKRSKYLLKLKNFMDAEFEIEDVQPGNSNWEGCAKRIVLKLPKPVIGRDGKIQTNFASNIEGDQKWLRKMYQERKKVIGLIANCEFSGYSEFGIPQIPYVRFIRNYE